MDHALIFAEIEKALFQMYSFYSKKKELPLFSFFTEYYEKPILHKNKRDCLTYVKKRVQEELLQSIKNGDLTFLEDLLQDKKRKQKELEDVYEEIFRFSKEQFPNKQNQLFFLIRFLELKEVEQDLGIYSQRLNKDYTYSSIKEKIKTPGMQQFMKMYLAQEELFENAKSRSKYLMGYTKKEAYEKIQTREKEFIEQLLLANELLIWKVVYRYSPSKDMEEDLYQEGCIGFLEGVFKYDYRLGVEFSTYIFYWIREKIRKAIYKNYFIPHTAYYASKKKKYDQAREEWSKKYQMEPTQEDLEHLFHITKEKLLEQEQIFQNVREGKQVLSLDAPISSSLEFNLQQSMEDECNIEEEVIAKEAKQVLKELLEELTKEEREVLDSSIGLTEEAKTDEEIGKAFHLTSVEVKKLKKLGMSKVIRNPKIKLLAFYSDYSIPKEEEQEEHSLPPSKEGICLDDFKKDFLSYFEEWEYPYVKEIVSKLSVKDQEILTQCYASDGTILYAHISLFFYVSHRIIPKIKRKIAKMKEERPKEKRLA